MQKAAARAAWVRVMPKALHHALGGLMVVVGQLGFVPDHLAVELVYELVDSGVQVFMGTFSKQIAALDVDIAFGSLSFFLLFVFFDRQKYFDIHHLVKVPGDSV